MSIQRRTDTHMHGHTITHMTEWLAADIHRWGVEKEANPNLFTSLLNKAALSVRLISNMFRFGALFSFCPFYFQILFSSLLPFFFLSTDGSQSRQKKNTKKERKKKWNQLKKEGDKKKILFNFQLLELWFRFQSSVFFLLMHLCWLWLWWWWRLCPGSPHTSKESICCIFLNLPRVSTLKQAVRQSVGRWVGLAGWLAPLSVPRTLAHTIRSDPHTAR